MLNDHFIQKIWQLLEELKEANKQLGIDMPKELHNVYKISEQVEEILVSLKDKENHNLLHLTKHCCKQNCKGRIDLK